MVLKYGKGLDRDTGFLLNQSRTVPRLSISYWVSDEWFLKCAGYQPSDIRVWWWGCHLGVHNRAAVGKAAPNLENRRPPMYCRRVLLPS